MQLFYADTRKVWKAGEVAGLGYAELARLFERYRLPRGTPILLDDAMRPVEPLSTWFRSMALDRMDAKTMKSYALTLLMLLHFLMARGSDLLSATEADIKQFRQWRLDEDEETVEEVSWDRDSAALGTFYKFLKDNGYVAHRPWRSSGKSTALGSGISRDLRVRHMELDQYLFLRDVGFGGLTPDAVLDESFGGWCPHRNRVTSELALMTGMRIQEWSTLLMPELGLEDGRRPATAEVDLAECAKYNRPRTAYVPRDVMELLDPYLLLERPQIVSRAQRSLRRRHRDLFVVQRRRPTARRSAASWRAARSFGRSRRWTPTCAASR